MVKQRTETPLSLREKRRAAGRLGGITDRPPLWARAEERVGQTWWASQVAYTGRPKPKNSSFNQGRRRRREQHFQSQRTEEAIQVAPEIFTIGDYD